LATVPFVFWFMFHIAARTAMVALAASLVFLACADLWVRSRRLAVTSFTAIVISAVVASVLFYNFALRDKSVDAIATDAFSRTVREIQSDDPGFRLPIWERTWHRIIADPDHLLLGKGIGSFAIDEGAGPPDWLIRKTEGARHSPHNIHLDTLYESGLLGMLLFTLVAAFPLFVSLRYWRLLSAPETSVILMYVFWLVTEEISGAFAFTYDFQFFLALAIAVIALKRKELAGKQLKDRSLTGPLSKSPI
jgi:O-antigen ligase